MSKAIENFIDHAITKTKLDSRLCGLAAAGSVASGEFDEFSDLDLIVVANDQDYQSVFDDRLEIAKSLGSNISHFTGEHVGEPRLLICLYRSPLLHVDLKFVKLADFHERIEDPKILWETGSSLSDVIQRTTFKVIKPDFQYLEDRIWTWIHYGATKTARGELFEAISLLSFIREVALSPIALWQAGKPVRGIRRIELHLPDFALKLRRTLPQSHDRQSCLRSLQAAAEIYKELRSNYGDLALRTNPDAEYESLEFVRTLIK